MEAEGLSKQWLTGEKIPGTRTPNERGWVGVEKGDWEADHWLGSPPSPAGLGVPTLIHSAGHFPLGAQPWADPSDSGWAPALLRALKQVNNETHGEKECV